MGVELTEKKQTTMKSCLLIVALLSAYCPASPYRRLPGGIVSILDSDPEAGLSDAKLAHSEHLAQTGLTAACAYQVHKVTKYSTQVVAGELVRVSYTVKSDNNCPAQDCEAKIWKRVWMNPQNQVFIHKCE